MRRPACFAPRRPSAFPATLSLVVSVVVVPHPSPALPCLLVSTYPCAQTSHVAPVSGPDKGQSCALPRVASPFPHPWPDRGELCMIVHGVCQFDGQLGDVFPGRFLVVLGVPHAIDPMSECIREESPFWCRLWHVLMSCHHCQFGCHNTMIRRQRENLLKDAVPMSRRHHC